ncbi:Diacylglycerol kinase [Polystyrenella longa]|uniref:Diacylglycerol kinase n=1 Tax=Polystyrenella longa TaxID=2528007 RepID=A0A518CLG8_9PLAN|nr:diacylglycerol kinase family protein [Polystyrenella longa]QDU80080.1 Diacylglycerol kinase [Polystyrenella longa]
MSKELVFWNSDSGKADGVSLLRNALSTDCSKWVKLSRDLDLAQEIENAISEGCRIVVAAGGDGTVNAIVNALMSVDEAKRPELAIIPLGTANDFAGTLQIPDDVNEAVELIRSSHPIPVDVVHISGEGVDRYYANIAAGGNSVRVSEALTDEIKSRWGAFAYIRGGVEVLSDMKTFRITAKCDDEEFANLDTWAILVANGKTNAGRITVAPKASPIDGLIDVIIIRDGDMIDMVQIVADNLLGEFLESEKVIFRQVKSLHLNSVPHMRFALDGEVVDEEPVQFKIVPAAIRMYVGTDAFN